MLLRIEGTRFYIDAPDKDAVWLCEKKTYHYVNESGWKTIDKFSSIDDAVEFFRQWKGEEDGRNHPSIEP